jgi:hypothetical protein
MNRVIIFLVFLLSMLQGCAARPEQQYSGAAGNDFYRASLTCLKSSEKQITTQVPTGKAVTTVEVPVGFDSNIFGDCMKHAGHPPFPADPEPYLATARKCPNEAKGASNPEEAYANCVGRTLDVEVISGERPQ